MSPPAEPVATEPGISASRVNERLRSLVSRWQTVLSVAFDLPTQFGYDSGDPVAAGQMTDVFRDAFGTFTGPAPC